MADSVPTTTYVWKATVAAPPDELMAGGLRRSLGQRIREGVGEHTAVTVYVEWSFDDGTPEPLPPPKSEAETRAAGLLASRRPPKS